LLFVSGFFAAAPAFVAAARAHFACAASAFSAHCLAAASIIAISSLLYVLVVASTLIRHPVCISHDSFLSNYKI
jgi:hypothetical protein